MIAAIIQARMASTRLPGKVMMDIHSHPMLYHVVKRVSQVKKVDSIIVATSDNSSDDPIACFCKREGIVCFRGSENDVLDRYYQAAKWFGADIIVRITADCALIDPLVIDKIIDAYLGSECDYASNLIERTYPDGLDTEVFSFEALKKAWREANFMSEREHVTPYIWKNKDTFELCNVSQETDLSNLRWTVDEPEDLEFVRKVYDYLYQSGRVFLMEDIVNLLKSHQELVEINKRFVMNEGYLRSLREDHIVQHKRNLDDEV